MPDFWTGELATSTIMLADRIDEVRTPVTGEKCSSGPTSSGRNEIHRTTEATFRRDRELIVVFLIYNPPSRPERTSTSRLTIICFDDGAAARRPMSGRRGVTPPARAGERYVTRTPPQRFKPSTMGTDFDPATGPIMAGQGILLSSFQEGEYRLGITVTDCCRADVVARRHVYGCRFVRTEEPWYA